MTRKTGERVGTALEARLGRYGLRLDALNAEVLHVGPRSTVRLDAGGRGVPPARWLRPSSLTQLKEWIGVPQAAASKNAAKFASRAARKAIPAELHERAKTAPSHDEHEEACRCGSGDPVLKEHAAAVREAVRQYLFGDARKLAALEPLLRRNVAIEFPFWLFRRVEIEKGGVLEFGAGANTLVADSLVIERGGEIRSSGALTINCRRIARS